MERQAENSGPRRPVDLTIFVSCFNEEDLIGRSLRTILDGVEPFSLSYEVFIYDDCSRDGSVNAVRRFIDERGVRDRFELIPNERNMGIGVNYFRAAERGSGRYFFVMHGDDAVHVDALRAVLNLLGKADVIIPYYRTRLFNRTFNCDHRTFIRRFISIVFSQLVRAAGGSHLWYFNGPVLHLRENVLKFPIRTFGLGYQAELLCELLKDPDITVLQVRVHNYDRATGKPTAFKIRNVMSVLASLGRIALRRFQSRRSA